MRTGKSLLALAALTIVVAATAEVGAQTNLAPDASFEAPAPPWFAEAGGASYFAGKERVPGAADGNFVLAVRGWDRSGSKVLSPVFPLTSEVYSGALRVRSFGAVAGASVELALFDEKAGRRLASFGTTAVDGKGAWSTLAGAGKGLSPRASKGRLAVVVSGPQQGARIEVDQVGLFAGPGLGPVTDNADFTWFEAETMADGKTWKAQKHYPDWYSDLPSGGTMLAGYDGVAENDNRPAAKTVAVRVPGPHRLWARLLRTDPVNHGTYTVMVRQKGKVVASREIDDGDPRLGPDHDWVWAPLDVTLAAGAAEVLLRRPSAETSWVGRKVDLVALTNLLDYTPRIEDFRPQGYLRFTNRSEGQAPFCLWLFVRRHQPPVYFAVPGMLSTAGLSGSYYVPEDKEKWLGPGQASPWVRVSDFLLPGGGRNNVRLLATRKMHTDGFVSGRVRGGLEFAVGPERRVVKTIDVDQDAPQVLMTLPYDFVAEADQILTAADYLQRSEAVVDKIGTPKGRVARRLDLNVILDLQPGLDDPKVIGREIAVVKRLGFNGTYLPVAEPKAAVDFNIRHGLEQHFGIFEEGLLATKNDCQNQPAREKIDAHAKDLAARYAPLLNQVERMKLADEPSGMPYAHFASCAFCKKKLVADLQAQGLAPKDLGVACPGVTGGRCGTSSPGRPGPPGLPRWRRRTPPCAKSAGTTARAAPSCS